MRRAKASQARKGFWAYGTVSFGYKAVSVEGGKKLVVTEETREDFEVVQRIFRIADEGQDGARRIAERLTREGVEPPSVSHHPREVAPGMWRARHIHNILKNPVYCGHTVNFPVRARTAIGPVLRTCCSSESSCTSREPAKPMALIEMPSKCSRERGTAIIHSRVTSRL